MGNSSAEIEGGVVGARPARPPMRLVGLLGIGVAVAVVAAYLVAPLIGNALTSVPTSPGSSLLAGAGSSQETAFGTAGPTPSPPAADWTALPSDGPAPSQGPTPSSGPTNKPGSSGPPPTPAPAHAPIVLGAFIPGAASDPSKIDAYAKLTGAMPRIVMWYQAWAGQYSAFDTKAPNAVRARGAMPMISWEPSAGSATDPTWTLKTILDGKHDAYIRSWTHAAASWSHPIYVRLMYEMNGPWSPWGVEVNGNTPSQFIAAWRHIVTIARQQGATNIRWVWAPNIDPRGVHESYGSLYPGDAYVNWAGLDGFNWGATTTDIKYRNIQTLFETSIAQVRGLTSKPLLIGETASNGVASKAAWIRDGLGKIASLLPAVRAVVWYDQKDPGSSVDWRVNSSSLALSAFRQVATSRAFAGRLS